MTTDLEMLAWVSGATIFMWFPYILAHIANVGLMPALTYSADDTPLPKWAERPKRAHRNAIENLAPFAALVIAAHLTGAANEATAMAAVVYFWSRMAHFVLYIAGVPFGRTTMFAIAWAAMLWIFWQIVSAAPM